MPHDDPHATSRYRVHDDFLDRRPDRSPRVHVVGTGGTIANRIDAEGFLPAAEVVERVPVLEEMADITTHDVTETGGTVRSRTEYVQAVRERRGDIAYDPVWFDIHDHLRATLSGEDPPDGVVVTHGSNTVEETGYFLGLTLGTDVPVVLTAAQRWHGMVGDDGPWNLVSAVRVAGDPAARGRGVLLAANDRVHAVRDATKVVSGRPDAWRSGDHGPLGAVDKRGRLQFYRSADRNRPAAGFDLDAGARERFPTVEVVYSVAGAGGGPIDAAVDRGVDGIVLAGFPTGDPAANQRPALSRAVERGVPVVLSHRGTEGWASSSHLDSEFVWADDLRPQKARILLALGLLETTDPGDLQQFFVTY